VMPWLHPRVSLSFISKKAEHFLKECSLSPWEVNSTTKKLHNKQFPSFALHYLQNLLTPHESDQAKVLNYFYFQKETSTSLIKSLQLYEGLLEEGHHWCYVEGDIAHV
jgi:hypothetical protein